MLIIKKQYPNLLVLIIQLKIIDGQTGRELQAEIDKVIETAKTNVALDLANVDFVTSYGISVLMQLHKRLKASSKELILTSLTTPVHDALSISKLDTIIKIVDDIKTLS